ncbi:ABC transporter permease [Oleiharenicola lentus]|uniref:ABC transporter permease n=1 Tax=Oleiharenicola lentus TaxID=2508720 RepID=A0A4Q1CCN6_9BACT|nr:ABC transporter permease [Oleiharenicola lentus]RXK56726.1 ABC transporter permease [Oleiharenicola lentus]
MSLPPDSVPTSTGMLTGVAGDLRHATRLLWKAKGLTATTLLTLALCIGATTAIFSTVYSLMLKPLPFSEPEGIVELYTSAKKAGLDKMPANVPFYLDYGKNASSYEMIALWTFQQQMVGEEQNPVRLDMARATAEIFPILRVQPLLGEFFTKEQNKPGADKVVVLTQTFWRTQYAEDPEIVGKEMRIGNETFKIIGVAPRVFEAWDARIKYVTPLSWQPQQENPQGRYGVGIQLFGRLKPGVTAGQADAEAKTLEQRYVEASPPGVKQFSERSGMTMNVGGVQEQRVQPVRTTLLILQGVVAFVLLIGCVNVANLQLVRANSRQSELAIRSALGAGRGLIARQLMLESVLLTAMGAVLGIALAWAALRGSNFYLAKMLPLSLPATLDYRVLGFAIALTVAIGLLIGLIPVFHILRTNLAEIIQSSSRSASSGRGVRALSSVLVVVQVAVALMLLTGAGLLIHSFSKALAVSPGFDPKGVVTARIIIPQAHRATAESADKFQERLRQSLQELPGVTSVALSGSTPFQGGLPINAFTLEQDTLPPGSPQPGAFRVQVTPGYAETLGLKVLEGRFYTEADRDPKQRVFVVDESFARKFFAGKSAIGGRFAFGPRPEKPEDWPTIIGVVRDIPHNGVEEKSGNPFIYQVVPQGARPGGATMFVRTSRPPEELIPVLRAKMKELDPTIFLYDVGSMEKVVGASFDNRRAVMLLLAAFAGLALFLSALGIYGVLAYDVSQRTREIGVRGAIGASQSQIVGLILTQGLWKAGLGVVIGLVGSFLLSRYMTSMLFGVQPTDPMVYGVVALVLILVALLASYLPARRAAKIDPLVALRDE